MISLTWESVSYSLSKWCTLVFSIFISLNTLHIYFILLQSNRTYASKYIPIIASVSEHQPPTWPSYFMDINVLAFLVPAGIIVRISFSRILVVFEMFQSLEVILRFFTFDRHAFCHYLMLAHL